MLESNYQTRLLVKKDDLNKALAERIHLGNELLSRTVETPDELAQAKVDWVKWYRYNLHLMLSFFSDVSAKRKIAIPAIRGYYFESFADDVAEYKLTVDRSIKKLQSFIDNEVDKYQECLESSYNLQDTENKCVLVESYSYEVNKEILSKR